MFRAAGLVFTGIAAAAVPLAAQQYDVERYRAAVEQLERRHAETVQSADQLDALLAVQQNRVSVETGGFIIDAPIEYSDLVREAAAAAGRRLREEIGAAADRIPVTPLTFNLSSREVPKSPRGRDPFNLHPQTVRIYTIEVNGPAPGPWGTREQNEIPRILADRLMLTAYAHLRKLIPAEFSAWSSNTLRPNPDVQFRSTYRELASSVFAVTRACRTDNTACLTALGLTETSDPWSDWYPGPDLQTRALYSIRMTGDQHVNQRWLSLLADARRTAVEACLAGDRAGCRTYVVGQTPAPAIGGSFREGVLEVAFRMAGEDAVVRLIDATGSTRERLEYIAGAPIDVIITEWKRLAFASAGEPLTVPFRTGINAIVWIAAFAGLSLRSTRWR